MSDREDRINEILDAIGKVRIVRQFNMRDEYKSIGQRLKLDLETLLDTDNSTESTTTTWRNTKSLVMKSFGGIYLLMSDVPEIDRENLKGCLEDILKNKNKNLISGMSYRIQGKLPEPPRFYEPRYKAWKIDAPTNLSTDTDKVLSHLAEIIVAVAMCSDSEDCDWSRADKDKIYDSIFHQIKTFIDKGELKLKKPGKIDISKKKNFPKPMLFLSDERNGLVWKFSKFCMLCGIRSGDCWCVDVDLTVTKADMLIGSCYNCYTESVRRGWTGEFSDKFKKESCLSDLGDFTEYYIEQEVSPDLYDVKEREDAMAIINEVTKKHGDYFEIELVGEEYEGEMMYSASVGAKTIPLAKFKKIFKIIDEWQDFDDYDPPDDVCSCPTW